MFKGSLVALITPFKDGSIDKKSLKRLIDFHVENGTDAVVVAGTTGESATLTFSEHDRNGNTPMPAPYSITNI